MTVPSSPWVKLTDVIAEFGPSGPSPAPNTLSSYKKSPTGPYVGVSTLTTNIPSTNPVYLHSFGGEAKGNPGTFSTSSGNGTVSIPSGAVSFVIEVWGAGGAGGRGGHIPSVCPGCPGCATGGGGGGAGGYNRTPIALASPISSHWGQTFSYSVGSGGTSTGGISTVTSVTYSDPFTQMIAFGGGVGTNGRNIIAGPPSSPGGIGGTASGGIFTATGYSGSSGDINNGGCGGIGYPGVATPYGGAGGSGGYNTGASGTSGSPGTVRFTWN